MQLTLPDGRVYRITSHVDATMEQTSQYLFNGAEQVGAVYEQYTERGGQSGRGDGLKQNVAVGSGGGQHVISVDALQYVDSEDQWGDSDPSDSAVSKRDELNHALNTTRISSDNPAVLELGEYSDGGRFGPLPVVMQQSTLGVSATDEGPSIVTVNLQMLEAADLSEPVDSEGLVG